MRIDVAEPTSARRAQRRCGVRPLRSGRLRRFRLRGLGHRRARAFDGEVAAYDPGENVHREGGILHTTTVPARLTPTQRTDAVLLAARILNALDYVGVMGVELFVTPGGLIVNEIAPRVHNSGHWTQNGCTVDQFEQHIRAVAGLALGDGSTPMPMSRC